ncbi:hypothetical protein DWG18_04130 [Lysobacter sp. TY2-98]|uniref:hypothetical protein n=1 Tax=Lysobacter sp. TY2-98 TaxID=2290922 RepID=UPI000E20B366|nr:hypothetical protein [Lysobacter sp. TY2-98]AXK71557.1 hypothetical protein DWG18_04130 [Lysobacter sp. TY2-98]
MTTPDIPRGRDTPASADPRPGANPGYAENQPRDKADARDPRTGKLPNPEAGGLDRPQGDDPHPAGE